MAAVAGTTALAMFWVVLPTIDIWMGMNRTAQLHSQVGASKGNFGGYPTPKSEIDRYAGLQTTHHRAVAPKGDFLGWFPETGNMELEFRITQTEDPLKFEQPEYVEPRKYALPQPKPSGPSILDQSTTRLVAFASSPFPFNGNGYRAKRNYRDPRALLHIPKGFDIKDPGVIVVFFHGHGATLRRDVFKRQRVPQQISESGVNAVAVAPQFAVDARDSSAGKFWKKGAFRTFIDDVAKQLAREHGGPGAQRAFSKMPVVIVAYSGGYEPAAWAVSRGGLGSRLKGLVLLDGLYGHVNRFANWLNSDPSAFMINAYAGGKPMSNSARLKSVLKDKGIAYRTSLSPQLQPGSITFLHAPTSHRHYVSKAWTKSPIADMLRRVRYLLVDPPAKPNRIAASQ